MTAERVRPTPRQAPPHSLDAERALLGSVLLDRSVVDRVTSIVRVTDFYSSQYGMIYATMAAIWERSEAVDYLTVMTELERTGTIREAGGMVTVAGLINDVPSPLHAESYAQIIADAALCRRLVSAGGQIASLGWRQEPDALAQAEQILDTVLPDRSLLTGPPS